MVLRSPRGHPARHSVGPGIVTDLLPTSHRSRPRKGSLVMRRVTGFAGAVTPLPSARRLLSSSPWMQPTSRKRSTVPRPADSRSLASPRTSRTPGGAARRHHSAGTRRGPGPPARGLVVLVGDTGFEPVTSSVSRKRATAAPIALVLLVPRWRRDSNPCIRLCRPLPRLSANPPSLDPTSPAWAGPPSGRRDSNPRPSPWQGDALPTEPHPRCNRGVLPAAWTTLAEGAAKSPTRALAWRP